MANQPTKYRKFVVGAASAALVASAVAPVASAATFTDIQGNTHEEAINALVDAGVINGYEDGTFKPNKTLTRSDVVKLMGKLLIAKGYEAPADYKTKPRFSDLKTTSNDELLKMAAVVYDNGVFVGKPDGSLDANGDITRENMAIVLVRAFDRIYDVDLVDYVKAQDFKKDVTDLGKAKAEARPAIDVLDFFDITNPAAPEFNPKNTTTRGQFASLLYKTTQVDFDKIGGGTVAPGVAAVKAVNNTTVEVTFKDKVDNIDSLKFTIDGLTVANAAIKQTDDKTVVLTTATQKGGEKYTVNLDGKAVGTFTGIQVIIPTSIKLTAGNNQAKVGDQVILTADIGVKEAGVPVTFNIDAPNGSLNKDSVVEVLTNEDGLATYSYTQYSPDADSVTVYPTGAPQLRDFATVYWGKDTILSIEEAKETAGNVLANGVKKTYTVTYKDPKTGEPLSNRDLNVSFVENINVPFNAISKATVTNPATNVTVTPYQTTTGLKEEIKVRTDSNGKATFIVSGTNTAVTPIVFVDGSRAGLFTNNTSWGSGTDILDYANGKWDSTELTVSAPKVTFEGAQLQSQITVTRNGDEEAAAKYGTKLNGREYTVSVKDKDGKAYANGLVNVSLDEILDRDLSTNSKAEFANVTDSTALYDFTKNRQQAKIKLDAKGEAKFILYGAKGEVGTPVVWIDQNTSENNQAGVLEDGEPFFKAPISNFQYERVIGGKFTLEGKTTDQTVSKDGVADFAFALTNQSGKTLENLVGKMTFEVRNTSGQPILVEVPAGVTYKKQDGTVVVNNGTTNRIEEYGAFTISADVTKLADAIIKVTTIGAKAGTVKVTPSFVTSNNFNASFDNGNATDNRDFNKYVNVNPLTATFGSSTEVPALYTGVVANWNSDKDELTFDGKEAVKFKGESGKKYEYFLNASPITEERFEDELKVLGSVNNKVSREVTGDTVKFFIIEKGTGAAIKDIGKDKIAADKAIDAINLIPALDRLVAGDKAAIDKARAEYDKLTADQKKLVPVAVYEKLVNSEKKIGEIVNAVPNLYSGEIVSYNTIDKTITFDGKTPVKYEGETGVSYRFFDELNRPLANSTDFFAALKKGNRVSREVVGNTVDFRIFANGAGAAVENTANNVEAAKKVTDAINALPKVDALKVSDKAAVDKARADYNALTADQKALVTAATLKTLTDAEAKIAELVAGDADAQAAKKVEDAIKALPAVDKLALTDKDAVDKARTDYDALTAAQKALVPASVVSTLEAAEAKIKELAAQTTKVEITSAEAFAMNGLAASLGAFVEYKVEGTVANTTETEAELVFTYLDQTQATKTVTVKAPIADGKFTYTLDTETDALNTIDTVQAKVGTTVSDSKKFAPKVKK